MINKEYSAVSVSVCLDLLDDLEAVEKDGEMISISEKIVLVARAITAAVKAEREVFVDLLNSDFYKPDHHDEQCQNVQDRSHREGSSLRI